MRPKILMVGRDFHGWALDTEFEMTRQAVSRFADVVDDPSEADVAHTVWPEQTFIPFDLEKGLAGIPLVAALNNDPWRLAQHPNFLDFARRHYTVVAQSKMAADKSRAMGIDPVYEVPLIADFQTYHAVDRDDQRLETLAELWKIPRHKYLIGLFQRDSAGGDLGKIRVQKGTDVFLSVIKKVCQQKGGDRVHVVIAGPRRHWLRAQLAENGIPFTFVGREMEDDDNIANHLDGVTMNLLFNLVDLYFIPTRWEGAPRQLLNVTSCRRKLLSMRVGAVPDLLEPECIVDDVVDAAERIVDDIKNDTLAAMVPIHAERVAKRHSVEAAAPAWERVYERVMNTESKRLRDDPDRIKPVMPRPLWARAVGRVQRRFRRPSHLPRVSLWGNGGGEVRSLPTAVLDALAAKCDLKKEDTSTRLHIVDLGADQASTVIDLRNRRETQRVLVRVPHDSRNWPDLHNAVHGDHRVVLMFPDAYRYRAFQDQCGEPNRSLLVTPTFGDRALQSAGEAIGIAGSTALANKLEELQRPVLVEPPERWDRMKISEAAKSLSRCGVFVADKGTSHEIIALAWHCGLPVVHDPDVLWDSAAVNARLAFRATDDGPVTAAKHVLTHVESYRSVITPPPSNEVAENLLTALQR